MGAIDPGSNNPLSSASPIKEKGSGNKRKFRADPSLADVNNLCQLDCANLSYEPLHAGTPFTNLDLEHNLGVCDVCKAFSYPPRKEFVMGDFQDADWSDVTETQLEELALSNLDMIYKTTIKRIASYGYTEEVVTDAVVKLEGRCHGCKDTISNIVDNVLALLGSGHEMDSSFSEFSSRELEELEKRVLENMVTMLREVQPFVSTGDAMWCLLICDMNVSLACAMYGDLLNSLGTAKLPDDTAAPQSKSDSNSNGSTALSLSTLDVPGTDTLKASLSYPALQTELPSIGGTAVQSLPSGRPVPPRNVDGQIHDICSRKEIPIPSSHYVLVQDTTIPLSSLPVLKLTGSKKSSHAFGSKRDNILRQKTTQLEKNYGGHGPKAVLRVNKIASLDGLMSDRRNKSLLDSACMSFKISSVKPGKSVEMDTTQANASHNTSRTGPSACSPSSTKIISSRSMMNTDLSFSMPSHNSSISRPKPNCTAEVPSYNDYNRVQFDKIWGQLVSEDKKDEMLLKLVPHVRELQIQLEEWNEWAQQKVMQAAGRLRKDREELQILRQERDEVACFQKEKQMLEENMMKKLTKMEDALSMASEQVKQANIAVHRLEIENSNLRLNMEASRLQAAKSAANYRQISLREMNTLKKFQSWEGQKSLLQEELATEKRKLSHLQQKLEQAKEYHGQLEARWRKEEKVKKEALAQAESQRKEREEIEVSAKVEEDTVRSKAESDMQRYKDSIQKLEYKIAKLRLTTDSSKVAALGWGLDGYSKLDSALLDMQEYGKGDVQRDWECVMCLTEEMSVVFLPCAHQVVCTKCSEMHEKQGMKDCPSCRTPIQQRIHIQSVNF